MPTAFRCREANVGDAGVIAQIHVDGWRAAYSGVVPAAYLNSLCESEPAARWTTLISKQPGSVLLVFGGEGPRGWISFGPSRDAGGDAEIYALYVLPAHKRQGAEPAFWRPRRTPLKRQGAVSARSGCWRPTSPPAASMSAKAMRWTANERPLRSAGRRSPSCGTRGLSASNRAKRR